ncbi:MAG: hypothetical protein NC914_01540 [Candidatus Omnitrophica bacterium]|nr:hypothetical protein [Candidatus Omnitrophota bacterium]
MEDNFVITGIKDWKAFLSDEDKQAAAILLKKHANSVRPLGDNKFIQEVERLTGRILRKQKPGTKKDN